METPAQFISWMKGNDRIGEGFYELTLSWDPHAPRPMPGQFLTIRVGYGTGPLLRRPFAFAGFDAESSVATVIYQERGAGTELLAAARPGDGGLDVLDVLGPLGTPFVVDTDQQKHVIVAGGIGLGPMLFLASAITFRNIPVQFIFGCRNQSLIPSIKKFPDAALAALQFCTDDGSIGFRGTVADYIQANVALDAGTTVYACGPTPMLKAVNGLAQGSGARCLVSVEAVMACGVGACMGCAVPVAGGGYARVCKDGPVFDGGEVLWELM